MSAVLPSPLNPNRATAMLVLCCVFWGLSFPLMPIAVDGLAHKAGQPTDGIAVGATINAWRYGAAAILLALAVLPSWRRLSRDEVTGGLVLGAIMGVGMFLQILGLAWVLPSVSGMLSATPVVLAPLAQALILRRPVTTRIWLCALIAAVGCVVLTWGGAAAHAQGSLTTQPPFPYAGELVTLASALCFTGFILLIGRVAPRAGGTSRLCSVMFLGVAVLNGSLAVAFGDPDLYAITNAAELALAPLWATAMGALVVLCTIGALWLMNRAQPSMSPARAAVLYTLEPVFGTLFSLLMGQERLTAWTVCGGMLVVAGAAASIRRLGFRIRLRRNRHARPPLHEPEVSRISSSV